jgi:hypothetical protein
VDEKLQTLRLPLSRIMRRRSMLTSFPALGGAVVKARSEVHDEDGIEPNSTALDRSGTTHC